MLVPHVAEGAEECLAGGGGPEHLPPAPHSLGVRGNLSPSVGGTLNSPWTWASPKPSRPSPLSPAQRAPCLDWTRHSSAHRGSCAPPPGCLLPAPCKHHLPLVSHPRPHTAGPSSQGRATAPAVGEVGSLGCKRPPAAARPPPLPNACCQSNRLQPPAPPGLRSLGRWLEQGHPHHTPASRRGGPSPLPGACRAALPLIAAPHPCQEPGGAGQVWGMTSQVPQDLTLGTHWKPGPGVPRRDCKALGLGPHRPAAGQGLRQCLPGLGPELWATRTSPAWQWPLGSQEPPSLDGDAHQNTP